VSPVSARTRARRFRAIVSPSPRSRSLPVTSMNASSSDSGSISGEKSPRIANTCSESAW
jgi:hypothetical protein